MKVVNFNSSIFKGIGFEAGRKSEKMESTQKRILTISFVAFFIAVLVSFIARGLIYLIDFFTNIAFYGMLSFLPASPAANSLGIFVIIVPAVGGIVIGLMAFYGSKAIRGHGIPEAMEQILTNQSKINPVITYLKPFSSAISIGTGGPFGAEGPIIATGGALGSTLGQVLKISHNERKILLAAGATAGMSAIFGSPLAAIFLAIELLLFEFSARSLLPVAIACLVGAIGHQVLFEGGVIFKMPLIATPDNMSVGIYCIMGLLLGFISIAVSKAIYFVEDNFEKLPIHWMWWPALGGLVVGIIGYFSPLTLGVGYDNITSVLSGTMPVQLVFSLCILKFISWAIALGSGTSGGTLAPLLTIGGATGALLATTILHFFPHSGINISLGALIGMSAMFAGASRAVITSIIFSLETTSQAGALLPLLGACTASYLVSFLLMKNTIMTEKIARRGIQTPHTYEQDPLEKILITQVLSGNLITVNEERKIKEVCELIQDECVNDNVYFAVLNKAGEFKGVISVRDLIGNSKEILIEQLPIQVPPFISSHLNLRRAVEEMVKENTEVLVVREDQNRVLGLLSSKDIVKAYKLDMENHHKKEISITFIGRNFTKYKSGIFRNSGLKDSA